MNSHNPVAVASSVSDRVLDLTPRQVWVIVLRSSESAVNMAALLAPARRTIVAHFTTARAPCGQALVREPADKGTLPALASTLIWLDKVCDDATVIVLGPDVKNTPMMVRPLRRAVGLVRMDRNRITAIGSSAVVARDDVLKNTLSRFAPEWWWPLWDVRHKPGSESRVYQTGARKELDWRSWIEPTPGPRQPLTLFQQFHPTPPPPPMTDFSDA